MRTILYFTSKNRLGKLSKVLNLDFLTDQLTPFECGGNRLLVARDTWREAQWIIGAAPHFNGTVHMVHHQDPPLGSLTSFRELVTEQSPECDLRRGFDGMHEITCDDNRCWPYLMLVEMILAHQSKSSMKVFHDLFNSVWGFLQRHDEEMGQIEAHRSALKKHIGERLPEKPKRGSEVKYKLVGFGDLGLSGLLGDIAEQCPFEDIEPKKETFPLIVLCESTTNEAGNPISPQRFYGIDWVKMMRMKGMTCPVLFVSALARSELLLQRPQFKITTALKHGFLQLKPERFDQLESDISALLLDSDTLDGLELDDVQQTYCSVVGLVQTMIHELVSVPEDQFPTRAERIWTDMHLLLSKQHIVPALALSGTKDTDIKHIRDTRDKLLDSNPDLQGMDGIVRASRGWSMLLLDDELTESDDFILALKEREVSFQIADTTNKAIQLLRKDQATPGMNQILLAVADYRLRKLDPGDNELVDQPTQGYHFIREASQRAPYLRTTVLSGLPRKFVMGSLRRIGVHVGGVFSKIDYFNKANYGSLADQLVELGNENAEAITRLLKITASGWKRIEPYYFEHRRHPQYPTKESEVAQKAAYICANINTHQYPSEFKACLSNIAAPKEGLITSPMMTKFYELLICRRVALWYSITKGVTSPQELNKFFIGDAKDNHQNSVNRFNTTLGLRYEDIPWCTTIEEKNWLVYQMGLKDIIRIEDEEAPIIAQVVHHVNELIVKNGKSLKQIAPRTWSAFPELRYWLDAIEVVARTHESLRTDFANTIGKCKQAIALGHPDIDLVHSVELTQFSHQLSSIRDRIKRRALAPRSTLKSDASIKAYGKSVRETAWRQLGLNEETAREALELDFFETLLATVRRNNGNLPSVEAAATKLCNVYRDDEGHGFRRTNGPLRKHADDEEDLQEIDENDEARMAALRVNEHPQKASILALAQIIRAVSNEIEDGVQWGAPSFLCQGHFATFVLDAEDGVIRVVFELPSTPQTGIDFLEPYGDGKYQVAFVNQGDIAAKKERLVALVTEIVTQRLS